MRESVAFRDGGIPAAQRRLTVWQEPHLAIAADCGDSAPAAAWSRSSCPRWRTSHAGFQGSRVERLELLREGVAGLSEIGAGLGLTAERARQIEVAALTKLRHALAQPAPIASTAT
jgi:sigma-70-like protein